MAGLLGEQQPRQGLLGGIFSGMGRGLLNPGGFFVNEGWPAAQGVGNMVLSPFVQANQAMPWGGNDPGAIGINTRTGSIDPSLMVPFASNMAGMATAGAGMAPAVRGGAGMGIRAYHGSPHDFDRFSMDRIGTGEGAQAYGHGLYFADNERVAKSYKDIATQRSMDRQVEGGGRVPDWVAARIDAGESPDDYIQNFKARVAEAEERVASKAPQYWNDASNIPGLQEIVASLEKIKSGAKLKPPGRMYEVDIDASPDEFLDWDKPLSEQSPKVREAILREAGGDFDRAATEYTAAYDNYMARPENATPEETARLEAAVSRSYQRMTDLRGNANKTGAGAYNELASGKSYQDAAEALRAAGIKGIRYKDAGSRSAEGGTSNYVVFDDKTISILKKYGIAGLTAGGAGAAMFGGSGDASAMQPSYSTGGRF